MLLLFIALSFLPQQIKCSHFFYNVAVEYNTHINAVTFYIFQIGLYIGEICRYIMAVPPKPEDTHHHIRCMLGNGMRATIWKDFIERFKIKEMREVYGVTEGNVTVRELLIQKITSRKHTWIACRHVILYFGSSHSAVIKYHASYAFRVCTDSTIPLFCLIYSSTTTWPVIQLLDKNLAMTPSMNLITKTFGQTDRLTN